MLVFCTEQIAAFAGIMKHYLFGSSYNYVELFFLHLMQRKESAEFMCCLSSFNDWKIVSH